MLATSDLPQLWDEVNNIPVEDRAVWLTSEARDYLADDVEGALQEMQGIERGSETQPSRVMAQRHIRPYGLKAAIIEDVASWATARYGVIVSARLVTTCWSEAREIKRDI